MNGPITGRPVGKQTLEIKTWLCALGLVFAFFFHRGTINLCDELDRISDPFALGSAFSAAACRAAVPALGILLVWGAFHIGSRRDFDLFMLGVGLSPDLLSWFEVGLYSPTVIFSFAALAVVVVIHFGPDDPFRIYRSKKPLCPRPDNLIYDVEVDGAIRPPVLIRRGGRG